MLQLRFATLAVALALLGCGGGDDGGSDSAAGTPGSGAGGSAGDAASLEFGQVESFTLDYLSGEAPVSKECGELRWVRDEQEKRALAQFTGTEVSEVLACDDVPYLAYLEYEDAAAAKQGVASALLPYLLADDTTVVMPLVAVDEQIASRYLEALSMECGCGEVVKPTA